MSVAANNTNISTHEHKIPSPETYHHQSSRPKNVATHGELRHTKMKSSSICSQKQISARRRNKQTEQITPAQTIRNSRSSKLIHSRHPGAAGSETLTSSNTLKTFYNLDGFLSQFQRAQQHQIPAPETTHWTSQAATSKTNLTYLHYKTTSSKLVGDLTIS